MNIPKPKTGEKKKERLITEEMEIGQKIAALKERERQIKKEKLETENLCIIEVTRSYNLDSNKLSEILASHFKAFPQDLPAASQNGTTPVITTEAVTGTGTQKSTYEKEKSQDDEL